MTRARRPRLTSVSMPRNKSFLSPPQIPYSMDFWLAVAAVVTMGVFLIYAADFLRSVCP